MALPPNEKPTSPRGSRWRLVRRSFLALFVLLAIGALAGAGYEAFSRRSDARRFRRPGKLVDMGGRSIHVHCTGGGSPTVVLDSAHGGPALEWRHVQPGIA